MRRVYRVALGVGAGAAAWVMVCCVVVVVSVPEMAMLITLRSGTVEVFSTSHIARMDTEGSFFAALEVPEISEMRFLPTFSHGPGPAQIAFFRLKLPSWPVAALGALTVGTYRERRGAVRVLCDRKARGAATSERTGAGLRGAATWGA